MPIDPQELDARFYYYPPSTPTISTNHTDIRAASARFADTINKIVPDGREKSLAITKVEEAMMWANAGIARNQTPTENP